MFITLSTLNFYLHLTPIGPYISLPQFLILEKSEKFDTLVSINIPCNIAMGFSVINTTQ